MDNNSTEPTFRGFNRWDLGYNPAFDVPPVRKLNIEDPKPDPGILAEYRYLFAAGGYVERSAAVDVLGGGPNTAWARMFMAAQRYMRGVPLPSVSATAAAVHDALKNPYAEGWKP